MSSWDKGKLDQGTVRKISEFLFGKPKNFNQFLDMRTDINSKHVFQAISYYRVLEEQYGCTPAGDIASLLERLLMSNQRYSRKEGVTVLLQNLPGEEILIRGIEGAISNHKKKAGGE